MRAIAWGSLGLSVMWLSTAAGVAGASIVALNLPWSGLGFIVFMVSSVGWLAIATARRNWPLAALNAAYTVINAIGIVRWLG